MELLRVICPCLVKEEDDTPDALKPSVFEDGGKANVIRM